MTDDKIIRFPVKSWQRGMTSNLTLTAGRFMTQPPTCQRKLTGVFKSGFQLMMPTTSLTCRTGRISSNRPLFRTEGDEEEHPLGKAMNARFFNDLRVVVVELDGAITDSFLASEAHPRRSLN